MEDRPATDAEWIRFLKTVAAPVVVSLIVGLGSSYFSVNAMMARFEERMTAQQRQISAIEARVQTADDRDRDTSEKLTRVETKVDILLRQEGVTKQ